MRTEQLKNVCDALKITCSAQYGAVEVPAGWTPGTHGYKVTLRFARRTLTVPFFMGPAHTKEPSAADVLACIVRDAQIGENDTFEEFCNEMCMDSDSRKAEETYKACVALAPRVHRFLGESFDRVANAEH